MWRRDFLRTSVKMSLVAAGAGVAQDACSAQKSGRDTEYAQLAAGESEEGVVIHPFESDVMRGSPPAKDRIVTLDTYEMVHAHRVWALQHMRELCPTQVISRGSEPVAMLPRKPMDIGSVQINDSGDGTLTVRQFLEKTYTDAFLVLHHGRILTEEYFSGMKPDTPHRLYSAGKSLLADVVAVLLDEGKLHEDARIEAYIPELNQSAYSGATIRQLLDMQSGVKYEYDLSSSYNSMTEHGKHFRAAGLYKKLPGENPNTGQYSFFCSLNVTVRKHGLVFSYKCSDTVVLAWVCERVTGCRYADLLSSVIWSKVGAEHDASIVCDPQGASTPQGGMSTTARDLARWGLMHLNGGVFQGRRVVPKQHIEDIRRNADPQKVTKESSPTPDYLLPGWAYRSQFWVPDGPDGAYCAWGGYGQFCYIHPETATVIVKFSSHESFDVARGKLEMYALGQIARSVGA